MFAGCVNDNLLYTVLIYATSFPLQILLRFSRGVEFVPFVALVNFQVFIVASIILFYFRVLAIQLF